MTSSRVRSIWMSRGPARSATTRLLAVGGGTQNALWLQATSDITGIDQVVCARTTGASYGDAFLAALAVGLVERADIARWNPAERVIAAQTNPVYEQAHGLFRRLYTQTRDIAAELPRRVTVHDGSIIADSGHPDDGPEI